MRRTTTHLRPIRRTAAVLATLALAAGCASANKRFEQGVQLEQSGRPADAAQRYIDALKKDRTLAEARTRLAETGNRAIADYLDQAGRFESVGSFVEAADVLRRLDDLRGDAGAVGVPLQPPAGYEQRRRATFDRAVDLAVTASSSALARRDYSAAIGWLERASQRWEPTPADRGRLASARYDALYGWAEGEMQAGRYRAAYERAGQAAALGGYGGGDAAALQAEALRRGTVRVAILPVGGGPQVRDSLPDDLLAELNDELVLNHWNRAPAWLDVVDPVAAAREARRRGGGRQPIDPAAAAQIGRQLGARVVVVMEIDSVRRGEADVITQRRAARTQAGADTAYTVREGRVETWARVTYRVVDAAGWGRVADQGTATARSSARFRSADYHGDWRTLQLSLADRTLFASAGRGYTRETVRELVSGLSERLGRDVYDAVLRRIE
jgi:tetratricopeptide (TPR) repeat protein